MYISISELWKNVCAFGLLQPSFKTEFDFSDAEKTCVLSRLTDRYRKMEKGYNCITIVQLFTTSHADKCRMQRTFCITFCRPIEMLLLFIAIPQSKRFFLHLFRPCRFCWYDLNWNTHSKSKSLWHLSFHFVSFRFLISWSSLSFQMFTHKLSSLSNHFRSWSARSNQNVWAMGKSHNKSCWIN